MDSARGLDNPMILGELFRLGENWFEEWMPRRLVESGWPPAELRSLAQKAYKDADLK